MMSKATKIFLLLLLISIFFGIPILRNVQASTLGETYVFFERMQVNKETELIILVTPSSDFDTDSEIVISFSGEAGDWCRSASSLSVEGVDSSAVDMGTWSIDEAIPGDTLVANCSIGISDSITISGIDALSEGVGYGFRIFKDSAFMTSVSTGAHSMNVVLSDTLHSESIFVDFTLIASDAVTVSADVADVSTITCGISDSEISFLALSKGTSYSTVQHTISTNTSDSTPGYYWAVYGLGDGSEAGLWKGTIPTSLIPSTGSSTINLVSNAGFGLVVTSPAGTIPADFVDTTPGVFGALNSGNEQSRMILYSHSPHIGILTSTITLGAKAALTSEVGEYTETLTYICGGFY